MPKIYTKTGDKGEMGTIRGRMSKSDQLAAAIGCIDELNSWIGVCRAQIFNFQFLIFNQFSKSKFSISKIDDESKNIQRCLFTIGSILAGSKKYKFKSYETTKLEKLIDKLTEQLPKLTNFVYPVGYLQVARSVARKAEREVVALGINNKNILKYLNRLSDALFVLARWVNLKTGVKEEVWSGGEELS